jgi:hypothetical protein
MANADATDALYQLLCLLFFFVFAFIFLYFGVARSCMLGLCVLLFGCVHPEGSQFSVSCTLSSTRNMSLWPVHIIVCPENNQTATTRISPTYE